MQDDARAQIADEIRRAIAGEIEAQLGVQRSPLDMPPLIADALLDEFEIVLKPESGRPMAAWPAEDELRERLAVIEIAVERLPGTQSWEHLLRDLLILLVSDRLPRIVAVRILSEWISGDPWPYGAEEALEFSLRELQWPEMQMVLDQLRRTASLRVQHNAGRVLEVYESVWPAGDIYRTYGE